MENIRLNYSFWRIQHILKQEYHYRLDKVWQGYKANRQPNYCERYNLIDEDANEILLNGVTLDALRALLTQEGYPLKEEVAPCKGAIEFLNFVEQQKTQQHGDLYD